MEEYSEINFFSEGIRFELGNENATRKWILSVLSREGRGAGEINFIFCSDDFLHKVNLEYLEHDTFTDIITFDLADENEENISGDIFVSIDRVKENADRYSHPFSLELHRVIVHGILHLLGYDDKDEEQKKKMRKMEDEHLKYLNYK